MRLTNKHNEKKIKFTPKTWTFMTVYFVIQAGVWLSDYRLTSFCTAQFKSEPCSRTGVKCKLPPTSGSRSHAGAFEWKACPTFINDGFQHLAPALVSGWHRVTFHLCLFSFEELLKDFLNFFVFEHVQGNRSSETEALWRQVSVGMMLRAMCLGINAQRLSLLKLVPPLTISSCLLLYFSFLFTLTLLRLVTVSV